MVLLAPPAPTRFDLTFDLLGIPVRVHPLFWVMALVFGLALRDPLQLGLWIVVVFVSVLVHEMGHALMMRRFGQQAYVVLHLMGGLTISTPARWGIGWAAVPLSPGQQVLISLAGPLAGFALAGLVLVAAAAVGGTIGMASMFGILPMPTALLPAAGRYGGFLVVILLWVNVVWGLVNLIPVYPLDGGNIARRAWMSLDPYDGLRRSLWLSVVAGALAAIGGLAFLGSVFVAVFFGVLAYQSLLMVRCRADGYSG